MATKPWRPVRVGDETGRFTRKQIEDAVRAVDARNEAARKNGERLDDSTAGPVNRTRTKRA